MGERADFAVLPVAIEAMKLLNQWGIANSFERLRHLNTLIWDEAVKRKLIASVNPLRTPHISILDVGERVPADLEQTLKKNGVHITVRGSKLRISPHVYNDEADIALLFDTLAANGLGER
jgi:selenocysteine lyase/cysteine desulfurase